MNASDRAKNILLSGLRARECSIAQIAREIHGTDAPRTQKPKLNPFAHPTRCEYERHLNDLPFPSDPPPSLINPGKPLRQSKRFGSWLYQHNLPEFSRRFELWRATQ